MIVIGLFQLKYSSLLFCSGSILFHSILGSWALRFFCSELLPHVCVRCKYFDLCLPHWLHRKLRVINIPPFPWFLHFYWFTTWCGHHKSSPLPMKLENHSTLIFLQLCQGWFLLLKYSMKGAWLFRWINCFKQPLPFQIPAQAWQNRALSEGTEQ